MSVIKSTTNGKNDRIEFAATEKAKVCTSVRNRYLAVEAAVPENPVRRGRGRKVDGPPAAGGTMPVLRSDTVFPNPIKGLQAVTTFLEKLKVEVIWPVAYTLLKLGAFFFAFAH
jgi:hypothetical protein